jgi:type I restriction-modification system DNA methylase subunit
MEYSTISKELTSTLSKLDKKNNGIYFTPPSCVNNNIEILQPYIQNITHVLEPSCGSCEYITSLHNSFPHLNITGIEYNEIIYKHITPIKNDYISIYNMDFLKYKPTTNYDLIIGNPPFYVMKKEAVDKSYYPYFEGRPNIFILFIIKSTQLLNDNGILSFVLPKNFLNCLYYDKTRKYINKHFQILHIIDCANDKYIDTQQDTIILIIQKIITPKNNGMFIIEMSNYCIFVNPENKPKIMKLCEKSKSLLELGFKVSVGTVVWNQCKDILTDDETKTRLIYSSDIDNNKLVKKIYSNDTKKNYINKPGIRRPMIVINRGYGVGEYKFNYCLIDEKKDYLIENHLICIESINDALPHKKLIEEYKKILYSLNDKRTTEFISHYFGNNAINTTELNNILPIYQGI